MINPISLEILGISTKMLMSSGSQYILYIRIEINKGRVQGNKMGQKNLPLFRLFLRLVALLTDAYYYGDICPGLEISTTQYKKPTIIRKQPQNNWVLTSSQLA